MNKSFNTKLGLVTVAVLSGIVLTSQLPVNAKAETPVMAASAQQGFRFVATVVDSQTHVLPGKLVTLSEVTSGQPKIIASVKTNDAGQAIFNNLPIKRNLSVSVDGQVKGYTIRTDVAGSHKAAAFYVDGKGTKAPQFSAEAAVVTVYDANGNTIANQEVTLTNSNGTIVAKGLTEKDGKARFANKLMAGTLYNIFVNGIEMPKTALVGSDVSVFLTDKQIKKEKPVTPDKLDKEMNQEKEKELLDTPKPVPPTSKPTAPIKNKKDDSPKKFTKSQSSSLKSSVKAIGAKPKAMTALAKKLPKTGDQAISILTLVGFIVTGLAIMLGFLKKSRSK
ncbi:TPA: LPXTG cell wall anchor domain-containing protein [Streptococcus agalactiae]